VQRASLEAAAALEASVAKAAAAGGLELLAREWVERVRRGDSGLLAGPTTDDPGAAGVVPTPVAVPFAHVLLASRALELVLEAWLLGPPHPPEPSAAMADLLQLLCAPCSAEDGGPGLRGAELQQRLLEAVDGPLPREGPVQEAARSLLRLLKRPLPVPPLFVRAACLARARAHTLQQLQDLGGVPGPPRFLLFSLLSPTPFLLSPYAWQATTGSCH
jgi:hypothetical protein